MARVIEERIIEKIENWKDGSYRLSVRDRVEIENGKATYYLWDYNVFSAWKVEGNKIDISFSFHNWGSQTTKNRISALLWHFTRCYIFRKNWVFYLKDTRRGYTGNYYKIDTGKCYNVSEGVLFDIKGDKVEPLKDFKR